MKLRVTTEVEAPEGATHYLGDLLEDPTWLKCRQIAAFDHWFYWGKTSKTPAQPEWILMSHYKPHWAKETKDHETKDIRGTANKQNRQYLLLRLSDGTVVKVRATLYYGTNAEMPEQDLTARFARELEQGAIMVSVDREGNEKRNLEVIHAFE